jgi:predicted PurR-regulated permease PerM
VWLKRRLRSDTLTAAIGVILVTLLILGPASLLAAYLVNEAADAYKSFQEGGSSSWRDVINRVPPAGNALRWLEGRMDVEAHLSQLGENIAGRITGWVRSGFDVITSLVITLFVLFFLYRDSGAAVQSLRNLLPMSGREADRVFERVCSTIQAVVNGSFTIAAIQALLATGMYWILGVPTPILWGAATFICALIPVFGTIVIWLPVALYLMAADSVVKGIVLFAWGSFAVGTIDNILYPYLVGDKLRLHTLPMFFSIMGGLSLFGMVGLILGPLVLAITLALLDIWWLRTNQGQSAEQAVAKDPPSVTMPGSSSLAS